MFDFLKQTTPRPKKELPTYYRRSLVISEIILAVYFISCFFLFGWGVGLWSFMPVAMLGGILLCCYSIGRVNVRISLYAYYAVNLIWCGWYVYAFGWGNGGQYLLIPLLMFSFFNIYEKPWMKLVSFLLLMIFRLFLFIYALRNEPLFVVDQTMVIVFQTLNSLVTFVILAISFAHFSTNIQATERELRLDNQKLFKEAGTDPLTGLPNRRSMLATLENIPVTEPFSIAIADIDFFKKVNDTYGHNCGDYTLQQIAALFQTRAGMDYSVCRWGGEEFCFFLPGKNLDEAGIILFDVQQDVGKMKLKFEENEFSITITIGVAENDFRSPVEDILEQADQMLYKGKLAGRNRVVM